MAQIYGSKNAQSLAIIWLYTQAAKHYHRCILIGNLTAQNIKIGIKYIKVFFGGGCGKLAQIYAFGTFINRRWQRRRHKTRKRVLWQIVRS